MRGGVGETAFAARRGMCSRVGAAACRAESQVRGRRMPSVPATQALRHRAGPCLRHLRRAAAAGRAAQQPRTVARGFESAAWSRRTRCGAGPRLAAELGARARRSAPRPPPARDLPIRLHPAPRHALCD